MGLHYQQINNQSVKSNLSMDDQASNGTDSASNMEIEDDLGARAQRYLLQPPIMLGLYLCVIAIIANILSLLAILQVRRHVLSHFRLIISLAVSDTLIAVSVMLHTLNQVVNPPSQNSSGLPQQRLYSICIFVVIKALNSVALNITLLNLIGMALDHYLAILRPLHHPMLMNEKRTNIMILVIWIIAIVLGFSDFFSGIPRYITSDYFKSKYNYCEYVLGSSYQEEYTVFAMAFLCCVSMVVMYVRIYVEVQRCQRRGPARQELSQNKKALVTTLLILGTFLLCWLPLCLFEVAIIIQILIDKKGVEPIVEAFQKANRYLYDLMLLNCIFDPVIYAIRMREVRYGYKKLFYRCCGKACHYQRVKPDYNSTHFTSLDESRRKSYILGKSDADELESAL